MNKNFSEKLTGIFFKGKKELGITFLFFVSCIKLCGLLKNHSD